MCAWARVRPRADAAATSPQSDPVEAVAVTHTAEPAEVELDAEIGSTHSPTVAPSTAKSYVWNVRHDDDKTCLVAGADIAAAGAALSRAGISDVRVVERLGELLG